MSAKWSEQPVKGTVADADVLLIIDSEAGPVDNKQILFSTLKLAAQSAWLGDIDAATFNLDNLGSVDFNNALGTNPIFSALQSASESTVILGSNFQISSGFIDIAEIATPANPATDVGRLYVKDDGGGITNLFFRDSAGTETDLVSGGGGGHIIEDEGTPLTQRPALNFIGSSVTVTDNAGTDATDVTISGGGASGKEPKLFFGTGDLIFLFDDTTIFQTLDFADDNENEDQTQFVVPTDTSFSDFTLLVQSNDLDAALTLTLRVNGVSSAAVITVPAATTGTFTSSASIDLSEGDLVNWIVDTTGATSGELEDARISFAMPSGAGSDLPSVFFGFQDFFFSFSETDIFYTLDVDNNSNVESDTQFRIPANSSFSNFTLVVPGNDLDDTFTMTLRVNGVSTAVITVPAATTGTFTSPTSVLLSKGDLVNWEMNAGSATTGELDGARISFSFPFDTTGEGTPAFFGNQQLFFPFDGTNIYHSMDFDNSSTIESNIQFEVPVDTSFSDFTLLVKQNTLDDDLTLTLRVNGVSTDGIITVPAAMTGTFTSPTSVQLLQNDLINWLVDTSATTGEIENTNISFSMPTSSGGGKNQDIHGSPLYSPQSGFISFSDDPFFDIWLDNNQITESEVSRVVPATGIYRAFHLNILANDVDDASVFTLRKNASDTLIVITVPASSTGIFTSGTTEVEFNEGDAIDWSFSSGSATGGEMEDVSISFEVV